MIYIITSLIFLVTSIILSKKTKINGILFSFFLFVFFIVSLVYIISDYFTGNGIDESVIYHITYGIEGAGLGSYLYIQIGTMVFIFLASFLSVYIYRIYKKNINKKTKNIFIRLLSFILLLAAIIVHPSFKNILELNGYFFDNYLLLKKESLINLDDSGKEIFFKDNYKIPENQILDLDNKNLVFIYLESFESLYLDESLFPGLSKGLNKLKEESVNFTNIKQSYGSSRTIAGMVASQCGIPLVTSGGGPNSMYGIDSFLPGVVCMGDFLNNAGYNLNYIGGSDLKFAGKGNFYKTHGFSSIEGKNELLNEISDEEYNYDWGLYDDSIFDIAFNRYEKLSKENKRFGLFLINMDTHGSNGVKSKKCDNLNYNNPESILNSYHCADMLVSDFINKIKSDENFKDTTIVLVSDHLAMSYSNSMYILNKKKEERDLLFFILNGNTDNNNEKEINKNGTTLDVGATVLSSIGFDVNQLGLGFNLLSNTGYTITDQNSNIVLSKWKNDYESFWEYPSIDNGIYIDIKEQNMSLKNIKLKIPALIEFDNNLKIKKIKWHGAYSSTSLYQKINKETDTILIDYCENIEKGYKSDNFCVLFNCKNIEEEYENDSFCVLFNSKKGESFDKKINDNLFFSKEYINKSF